MTTTQPAALPELPPLTGDILIEDRTIYVLNKNGENVWWATVYPGFHDNGIRVSDDQCRAVAADLARLAALQSAQPAEVSDESAYNLIDRFLRNNLHDDDYAEYSQALDILALRPQAVPMPEPVQRLSRYAGQTMRTARNPNITAREAIEIGDYLAAIGITAQGAQGEQA